MAGRGGCCITIAPFIVDMLQSLGFRAHVMQGFYAGNRYSFHYAVIVKDVVMPGDVHYIDVGTYPPFTRVMDVTEVVENWTMNQDAVVEYLARGDLSQMDDDDEDDQYSPLFFSDFQFHYQVANGKRIVSSSSGRESPRVVSTINSSDSTRIREDENCNQPFKTHSHNDNRITRHNLHQFHGPISTRFGLEKAIGAFAENENPLTIMLAKNDFLAFAWNEEYATEPEGIWLPQYVFPTPLTGHDMEITREMIRNPEAPYTKLIHQECEEGVLHAGFGRKTGDYLFLSCGGLVRIKGVPEMGNAASPMEEGGSFEKSGVALSRKRQPTAPVIQMTPLENEEEILALMHEEFPDSLEITRRALPLWP